MEKRKKRVIFCDFDVDPEKTADTDIVFSPRAGILNCCGCLDCWFQTPSKCRFHDTAAHMSTILSDCDELIVVSRCIYGSCSPFAKNLLDRSVSYVLPFFRKNGKLTAHFARYKNRLSIRFLYYGELLPDEKKISYRYGTVGPGY